MGKSNLFTMKVCVISDIVLCYSVIIISSTGSSFDLCELTLLKMDVNFEFLGGGPKPFKFKWTEEDDKSLLEIVCNYDKRDKQMIFTDFCNKMRSINKRPPKTVEALMARLRILQNPKDNGDKRTNIKWTPAMQSTLLRIGLEMLARKDRNSSLPYVRMMHDQFLREFPQYDISSDYLRQRFDKIHQNYQNKKLQELTKMRKEILEELTNEDLAKAGDIENNLPENLNNINRWLQMGIDIGDEPIYKGVCAMCVKLLFGNQKENGRWYIIDITNEKYANCTFKDEYGKYPIENLLDETELDHILPYKIGEDIIYICRVCEALIQKSNQKVINLIDLTNPVTNRLDLPVELENIHTDLERGLISLLGVYHSIDIRCREFRHYFLHLRGEVNLGSKKDEAYDYMAGLIFGKAPKTRGRSRREQHNNAKLALQWLVRHNELYADYFSNFQTLFGYGDNDEHLPFQTAGKVTTAKGADVVDEMESEELGILFPTEKKGGPDAISTEDNFSKYVSHPKKVPKDREEIRKKTRVGIMDNRLEAMAFPREFPKGTGSWDPKWKVIKHRQYCQLLLHHLKNRFRQNRILPFFLIDRYIKISMINHVRFYVAQTGDKQMEKPTAKDFENPSHKIYKKYGSVVAANIPGSKSFWWNKLQELLAIEQDMGRAPDYFFTATENDNWTEIQKNLFHEPWEMCDENCDHDTNTIRATDNPILCSIAFNQRFIKYRREMEREMGKIDRIWWRREYQKRGAVHIHGVVWIDPATKKDNVVLAEMPRSTKPEDQQLVKELRQLVHDFQTHDHLPERCFFRGTHQLTSCKYNYPAPLVNETRPDDSGIRKLYKRRKPEDKWIVPYSWALLLVFRSRVNIQEVNEQNWLMYLAKYVSKEEPSIKLPVTGKPISKDATISEIYLKMKVMSAVEVSDIVNNFPLQMSDIEVIYLPVPVDPDNQTRTLKAKTTFA